MQKPKLTNEEWRALANRLETHCWLIDSYDPETGKRCWRATRWGERHYQKACMLVNAEQIFSGKTLKQLQEINFDDVGATDKHLYELGLITEVFDDVHWHDTKALTRQGFEWFYAYTKLQGKKRDTTEQRTQSKFLGRESLQQYLLFFIL